MSEIYLIDVNTYTVLFEFDADVKESRKGAVKWTDKPVEDGNNISDYGYQPPEHFRIEGTITAWPMTGGTLPLRVSQADAALRKVRDLRQPVGLVTKWWTEEIVISDVDASQGKGDGERLNFTIECQTIRLPAQQYTKVPAAKLKAAVKKRAAPSPTKGGAASGKKVDKDWIYKIRDAITGAFG